MADPFRLSLVVQHADGTETRWGPDELDPADIPTNLQCSDTLPGGFEELSCDLLRRIDLASPDQNLLDRVLLLGPGNEVVWEGRFGQFPRETSDGYTVSPGAEGYSAHLRDDTSFREIYVDRRFSEWAGQSVQRRFNLASSFTTTDPQARYDTTTGSPALITSVNGDWTASVLPISEGLYDARGLTIGSLYYAWKRNANVGSGGTGWSWQAFLANEGTLSTIDSTGDLEATGPGTGTLAGTSSARKFAAVQLTYNTGPVTSKLDYEVAWTCLAVYGNHGLTKRGTTSATQAQGFYASDVLPNVLSRAAPLLNYTTGPGGSIATTSIVFEQLEFIEPTTAEEVIKKLNSVHLYPWYVWEDRTFYFQPDDDSQPWTVRLGDGARLKDDGPSGQQVINKVFVWYTDPNGQQRLAGPTGATGCNITDASLLDTDPGNPANAHGIPTKSETIRLSSPATDNFAVAVGGIYLTERAKQQRRGEAQITGMAQHPTMGMRPCWAIRAGDYIQFVDTLDDSISEPRRIIRKVYDHDRRQATLSLDSTPYTLDALLELLDAELINVT